MNYSRALLSLLVISTTAFSVGNKSASKKTKPTVQQCSQIILQVTQGLYNTTQQGSNSLLYKNIDQLAKTRGSSVHTIGQETPFTKNNITYFFVKVTLASNMSLDKARSMVNQQKSFGIHNAYSVQDFNRLSTKANHK